MKKNLNEKELQEKKSGRIKVMTLVSGIITLLFGIAMVGLAVYVGTAMIEGYMLKSTDSAAEAFAFFFAGWIIIAFFFIIAIVMLIVAALNITAGIFAIVAATKSDEKYLKRKGLVITSIVFDFLIVVGLFATGFAMLSNSDASTQTISLILLVAAGIALVSAIVKIVDIKRVSKRYKKFQQYQKDHGLEEKLASYKDMLDKGTITQEEYDKLRAQALEIDKK